MKINSFFIVLVLWFGFLINGFGQTGTCAQANDFGVLNSNTLDCGGDLVNRNVVAVSSWWNTTTDDIKVIINWGDGSLSETFDLVYISAISEWRASISHAYPDNGTQCVYNGTAILVVNGVTCAQSNLSSPFNVTVYDEIDNTNLGTHEVNHDPSSAGALNTDTDEVDVCEGVTDPVRLQDMSEFNCTQADWNSPPQTSDARNDRDRWIQWVYGSNETITGDIIIDGVTVNSFPYYGPVQHISTGTPTPPNELTFNIIMPVTALNGEHLEVTLRSWNICNPYDDNTFDGDPLNPVGGIFDPEVDLDFGAFPNGIEAPIETTQIIRIINRPNAPTPGDDIICEGNSDLTGVNFQINGTAGSTAINWYDGDPTAGGNLIINPNGNNSTTFPAEDHPAGDITTAPGDYSLWASYVMGGTNSCESPAVESVITVREELTIDDIDYDTGTDPVCAGTTGLQFSLANPATSETHGGDTEYVWTTTGGLNINGGNNGQSITVDVESTANGTETVSVIRRYTSNPECNSVVKTFDIEVDPPTVAGTLSGTAAICEDESSGTISLTGYTGTILYWERSYNGAAFSNIGNSGDNTFSEILGTSGIYEYRVVVESGACTQETSNEITITVNDRPSAATISGDKTICEGDNATLNLSVTEGTAPYTITIDNGVGAINWSGPGDDPDVSPTTTTTYTITSVVDANGCEPDGADITGSATITIGNPTDATIGGDASICNGDDTDLSVSITGGKSPFTVVISTIGTINGYESGDPINTGALFSSTTYTLTSVTDADGCPVLGISDPSATINVGVAISSADLNVNDVCEGEDVTFSVDIEDGVSPFTLTYDIDGGTPLVVNSYVDNGTINLGPLAANTYTINILKVADQCASELDNPDSDNITVNALPTAIDQNPEVCSDDAGGTTATVDLTTLENSITGGSGATVNWYEQNSPLSDLIAGSSSYEISNGVSIYAEVDNGLCKDIAVITYTVNPTPADVTNPVDAISCSSDAHGTILSVDDPGAGFQVLWFEDIAASTPATGTVGGSNNNEFTPTANIDFTYYTKIQNTTTLCTSLNSVAVQHTVDIVPSAPDAGSDAQVCESSYILNATPADNGGTGFWTSEGMVYFENFENLPDGIISDNGIYGWITDITSLHPFYNTPQDYFEVRAGRFESEDLGDGSEVAIWRSETIDVSSLNNIDISLDLFKEGRLETADFIEVYYELDGLQTKLDELSRSSNDPTPSTVEQAAEALNLDVTSNNTLVIEIRISSDMNSEIQGFDNIIVKESGSSSITFDDIFNPSANVYGLSDGANTLYWNMVSALGACNISPSSVSIIKVPAPQGIDLTETLCEDSYSSGSVSSIDLNDYSDLVIGTADINDRTVSWFTDENRTTAVPDPANVTANHGDVFYALITETVSGSGCTNDFALPGSITFNINNLPVTEDQDEHNNSAETVLCESGFASGVADDVDLTILNDDVTDGASGVTVTWLKPDNSIVADPGNTDGISNGDVYYAVVTNTVTGCSAIAEVEFTINSRPLSNPLRINPGTPQPIVTLCKSDELTFFQVNDKDLNSNTIYEWIIPSNPGEAEFVGGGAANFFVILKFPNVSSGMTLQVREKNVITQCYGPWNTVTIIVEESTDKPIVAGFANVCENQKNVVYTIQNSSAGSTYTWSVPATLGTIVSGQGTDEITIDIASTGGDITVSESTSTGCSSPDSDPFPVSITDGPVITSPDNMSICSGAEVGDHLIFTSDITSTFNWEVIAVSPSISGAQTGDVGTGTINQLLFNTSGSAAAITYEVIPTSADNCPGTPQLVTINVSPEPILSLNLSSEVCSNTAINISLETANSSVAAPEFRINAMSIPSGVTADDDNISIGDEGNKNLIANDKYSNLTNTVLQVIYEIIPIASGPLNCEGEPETVVVSVKPTPVLENNLSTTVCSNEPTGLSLSTATGSVAATEYTISNIIIPSGITAGAGNSTTGSGYNAEAIANDLFINTTNAAKTITYKIIPFSDGCPGIQKDVTVVVNPSPQLANLDQTVCSESPSGITLSATPSSVAAAFYEIINIRVASALSQATGNATIGTTTDVSYLANDEFINNTNVSHIVEYDVMPVSGAGCQTNVFTITLTVEPKVVANTVIATNPICSGDFSSIEITSPSVPSTGEVLFNYTATSTSGLVGGFIPSANNLPQGYIIEDLITNNDNSAHTVTYTITPVISGVGSAGCTGDPVTVELVINPTPRGSFSNDKQMICSGESTYFTLNTSSTFATGNISFRLDTVIHDPILTGFSPKGSIFSNGDRVTDLIINNGFEVSTATYRLVPFGPGCEGVSIDVNVTVNPEPAVTASETDISICSGDFIGIELSEPNGIANTFFRWVATPNENVEGETAGFGTYLFQSLRNTSSDVQTVDYVVTPELNGCTGIPEFINVTVEPIPDIQVSETFISLCEGEALSVELTGSVPNTVFEWNASSSDSNITGYSNGIGTNGDLIEDILVNTGSSPGTVTYSIRPLGSGANGCEGITKNFVVSVGPRITGEFLTEDIVKCNDNSPSFLNLQLNGIPPFEVVINNGTEDIVLSNISNFFVMPVNPVMSTTYTIKSIKDANGCIAIHQADKDQEVKITISNVAADFTIINSRGCSPLTSDFVFDQKAGVTYTWSWFDGSSDSIFTATETVASNVISHTFQNLSTNASANINVRLTVQLPADEGSCIASKTKNIEVFPIIRPNIIAENSTTICSGESISFRNFTAGASIHKWFYRHPGIQEELGVKTEADFINYSFTNSTSDNPLHLELVYQGSNGNCREEVVIPIIVYRGSEAGFEVVGLTDFISGSATLTLQNTSAPIDTEDFEYTWSFGANATPEIFTGSNPPVVSYSSPGQKTVTVSVKNREAANVGLSCFSTYTEQIDVLVPPIIADFTIVPVGGCAPLTVSITENKSTGDIFEWQVVNNNGITILTSNEVLPSFILNTPGTYEVILTTTIAATGQSDVAIVNNIQVYQNPIASFDLRPDIVYMPDPLYTFNLSDGAENFLWNFGDGTTSNDFEPSHVYSEEENFQISLVAYNEYPGNIICADTMRRNVTVLEGGVTNIPNAFTPNTAGPSRSGRISVEEANDIFLPITEGVEEFNMVIFDRWGNLIFKSKDQTIGWDGYDSNGQLLPAGVYVYQLDLLLSNGERRQVLGDVVLIK